MDFEEQLEKAEKSPYPSLVGASVKSADDSPHNNYIHPEKYTGVSKQKSKKKSILNSSIGASLDDLISEGALLGSEEDFDKFLDDKGNVLSDAKYTASESDSRGESMGGSMGEGGESGQEKEKAQEKEEAQEEVQEKKVGTKGETSEVEIKDADKSIIPGVSNDAESVLSQETDTVSIISPVQSSGDKKETYSNPNLSEYQIGHQIEDHSQLLDSVKSYDLSRLPSTEDTESRSKTSDFHGVADRTPARPNFARSNSAFANKTDHGPNVQVLERDSLHSPYFQTNDERSPSRSRARDSLRERSTDRSRSRSRSAMSAAHLARGDTYKNTHDESPMKYELPADMLVDDVKEEESETDERRSRQSKPTLGDSLAAVEAGETPKSVSVDTDSVTKEPSLVTSGDYTNFNAESSDSLVYGSEQASVRSESSRNYLRSISRSRSRKPTSHLNHEISEKNDSNTDELSREGALVSDDPYSQVGNLDTMMKQVLLSSTERSRHSVSEQSKGASKDVSVSGEKTELEKKTSELNEASEKAEPDASPDSPKKEVDSSNEPIPEPATIPAEASNNLITEPAVDAVSEEKEVEQPILEKGVAEAADSEEKPTVDDISAEEKVAETEKQITAEDAPKLTASDISVDKETVQKATQSDDIIETPEIKEESEPVVEASAEEVEKDAQSQVITSEAPIVTASDIKTGLTEEEKVEEKEEKDEVEEKEEKEEKQEKEENGEKEVKDVKKEVEEKEVVAGTEAFPSKEDSQVEEKLDEASENPEAATEAPETEESPKDSKEEKDTEEKETEESKDKEIDTEDAEKGTVTSAISSIAGAVVGAAKDILPGQDNVKNEGAAEAETKEVKEAEPEDLEISTEELRAHLKSLPVYIFTSLAGGMQIVNRTNRLTTILQANKVKFEYRDLGTDEEAKKLWRRYAQGKTLPGVIRGDDFIGNWEYIDEVNEDYRLQEVLYETL